MTSQSFDYYVYEWFIINTLEVFYVGKGRGMRRFSMASRNKLFMNIINKYNCAVRLYKTGLTEREAFEIEKDRIAELKLIGQARANFHIGGCGGDTGYRPIGEKNPFYGRKHKQQTIEKIRQKQTGKKLGPLTRKKMSIAHKGKNVGEKNPMYGRTLDKNPRATPILVINESGEVIKRFSCRKEMLNCHQWKKQFPKPNGTPYLLKCLKEGLLFHGYKLVYEKNFKRKVE